MHLQLLYRYSRPLKIVYVTIKPFHFCYLSYLKTKPKTTAMRLLSIFLLFLALTSCKEAKTNEVLVSNYFNYGDSLETAGVKMIPIQTPMGEFKVWTKRFGTNPKLKSYCFTVVPQ
jgi:hypothetical protein